MFGWLAIKCTLLHNCKGLSGWWCNLCCHAGGRNNRHSALQRQKAVSAYLKSRQILLFGFVRQYCSTIKIGRSHLQPSETSGNVINKLCDYPWWREAVWNNYTMWAIRYPSNPEISLYKPWRPKGFYQFVIIINVLLSSFCFIWKPILWVYDHYTFLIPLVRRQFDVHRRQAMTSKDDPCAERVNSSSADVHCPVDDVDPTCRYCWSLCF